MAEASSDADFSMIEPINPGELRDGDLRLDVLDFGPHKVFNVPTYHFRMVHAERQDELGLFTLRVGSTPHVELYAGHIGYQVHEPHRGNRYAARSVRLILPLARQHGINPLWITCDPDNFASRRTIELAGAMLVGIVKVPEDCVVYESGPYKCRYRL